jgi:two-component system chemotaxis response regulator CheY
MNERRLLRPQREHLFALAIWCHSRISSSRQQGTGQSRVNSSAQGELIKRIQDKHLKVLIIDDEDRYRASMRVLLEKVFKSTVEDVKSGPDGITSVGGQKTYDIIFLDLMMPDKSGNETYAEIIKINPELFIVFMSAYSDSKEWHAAEALGVPLLHKPIPKEDLIHVLSLCREASE